MNVSLTFFSISLILFVISIIFGIIAFYKKNIFETPSQIFSVIAVVFFLYLSIVLVLVKACNLKDLYTNEGFSKTLVITNSSNETEIYVVQIETVFLTGVKTIEIQPNSFKVIKNCKIINKIVKQSDTSKLDAKFKKSY